MFLQGAEKQYQKWKKQTEELISLDLARLNIESFKSMLVTRQQELQKRITALLRSKSEDLQIKGLRILRKLGEKAHFAERDLERLLGSANSDVKIETIKTVAKIGLNSGPVNNALFKLVDDSDIDVQEKAIVLIEQLGIASIK